MSEVSDSNSPTASDERLRAILNELHEESKDVQVSMVVTRDGLTMVVIGGVVDPDKVGAMCSDLLSLCHSAALELQRGDVEHVLMKASHGYMLLTPAGDQTMLAVMARPDANLGMLLIDTRRAANAIPAAL
jgi:predicted regulator of Ras-like GTPase activity (Roadblock/LC7/MglB family)